MNLSRRAFVAGLAGHLGTNPLSAQTTQTGLILIGASWCPVCKQAAPILAGFAQANGLPVLVASADERPIPPFQSLVPLSGHPLAEDVKVYPTTCIYSAHENTLVGYVEGYRNPQWYLRSIINFVRVSEGIA